MQVELKNITKHFGPVHANDNISYTFEPGRIYAILGENGAGKSTLMKILSGFQEPTSGQITLDGKLVDLNTPLEAIRQGIGMLYQDPQDFAPLSVLENYMSGRPMGFLLPRQEALENLRTRCTELGFDLNPYALVESLTIGERQQLEIARLLSLGVEVLILDEPTTGISAEQRAQLFDTLKDLARERHLIVIIVTHKFRDVEELCDEFFVLRKGRLVGAEQMPCPTERMVELMFGKRIALDEPVPSKATPEILLTIENLSVDARLFSIQDININIRKGEVIGLAGLDGSGQVDFMRTVAGLNKPSWTDHILGVAIVVGVWIFFGALFKDSPTLMWMLRGAIALLVLVPTLAQIPTTRTFIVRLLTGLMGFFRRQSNIQEQTVQQPRIMIEGQDIYGRGYRDLVPRGVIYLPAGRLEEGLVSGLTVVQHFALTDRQPQPWVNWFGAWRRSEAAIAAFDIRGRPENPIQLLSGGNQQRVALSLLPPKLSLLLLENPTRGLDVESARRIWSLLLERRGDQTAIIFSSPDLDEILDYSDRVLVFSSGRVTLVEDPSQLTTARLGELIGGKA